MRKIRGFKLGKRLIRISNWIARKTSLRSVRGYHRLNSLSPSSKSKPISKLLKWLSNGATSLCSSVPTSGYVPLRGIDPVKEKKATVPKGHLAVYVGGKDGDFHRVLIPVVYFNHPLFSDLLREAEEEYGYHQQGGITIPCGYLEFERVQTRIKAGSESRRLSWKPSWSRLRC